MQCMKCGRDVEPGQVFCENCHEQMEKYPVKPGTAVHLPIRKEAPVVRKNVSRRRIVSPEEQLVKLKKWVLTLSIALAVTLALVIAMAHPAVNYFIRKYYLRPGQNYSTIAPSTAAAEVTEASETIEATEDPLAGFAD